jgi:hypothetical protein
MYRKCKWKMILVIITVLNLIWKAVRPFASNSYGTLRELLGGQDRSRSFIRED